MNTFLTFGFLGLWASTTLPPNPVQPPPQTPQETASQKTNAQLEKVLAGLQTSYENTRTFSANFKQSYTESLYMRNLLPKFDKSLTNLWQSFTKLLTRL